MTMVINMFEYLATNFGSFYFLILIGSFFLIAFLAKAIINKVFLTSLKNYAKKNNFPYDNILLQHGFFHKLSYLVFPILLNYFQPGFQDYAVHIAKINEILLIIVILNAIFALINALNDIYELKFKDKNIPIKTITQVLKIITAIIGIVLLIAALLDESPTVLLSGLGALSALTMLVFRDAILGFVAGIQISANDMVRIDDWVEMPKYNANGDVIDITLSVIKIRNFDRTITNVPTYAFVSDSFINWRGMQESGGRRIMRNINICYDSVKFATQEDIAKYKQIDVLKDYIAQKETEIQNHNKNKVAANQRKITNLGTFRAYIQAYLKNHPKIHQELMQMVRQLEPNENGIPLEIYAFTNDTNWKNYEHIQSDIFDHIISIAPYFDLEIFQNPSSSDFKMFPKTLKQNNTIN